MIRCTYGNVLLRSVLFVNSLSLPLVFAQMCLTDLHVSFDRCDEILRYRCRFLMEVVYRFTCKYGSCHI